MLLRLKQWLATALARRMVWLTDTRRSVLGEPMQGRALLTVLGREHYAERRKAYPIRSLRDLRRVLAQELQGRPPTLTLIGPWLNERHDVAFFELLPGVLEQLDATVWVIPESLVLAQTLPAQRVAIVSGNGLEYFLAASGVSQIAGGAVRVASVFAMATGLDPDQDAEHIDRAASAERVRQGLSQLSADIWLRFLKPGMRVGAGIAWQPLAISFAVIFVAYLALGFGYLSITQWRREVELKALGPEVSALIESQHHMEGMARTQHALAQVINDRQPSYPLWHVALIAWQKGAMLRNISIVDGKATLNGSAPVATDVLAAVAADPAVSGARFASPVRQGVRQDFTITFRFVAVPHG